MLRKAKPLIAALLLALSMPAAPRVALAQGRGTKGDAKTEEKSFNLSVGESKSIPAGDVKPYSEGTPNIAEIKLTPDGRKFIVTGLRAGTTSLLLIKNDGSQLTWVIRVYSQAPDEVQNELDQLLQGYPGVRLRKIGTRLFIEGGVQNEVDLNRIKQIADLYPGQVESLVTLGAGAVDRNLNIRLDFFFVQYNRNASYGVGIAWPPGLGGASMQSNFVFDLTRSDALKAAQAAIVNQPLPALAFAASKGWAKVLKQSAVITINGNEATFASGGELNFSIFNNNAAGIQKIEFGTNVTMQPRFDPRSGDIEIRLLAEVADLLPGRGTALPGRATNKLSTVVSLKLGESLILSGIKTSSKRHDIGGLPRLSQIPILGLLFGSHTDQEEEFEGAMSIIPSVVESVPKGSYDRGKAALSQYEDDAGDIDEVSSFPKTPPNHGAARDRRKQWLQTAA